MSKSDPLDLTRRLRESIYGMGKNAEPFDLGEAADLIERQHAELERVRAIEKAAIAMTDKYRAPNFVNDEPCDLGSRYCRAHEAEFDEWAETCALGALRAALRGEK